MTDVNARALSQLLLTLDTLPVEVKSGWRSSFSKRGVDIVDRASPEVLKKCDTVLTKARRIETLQDRSSCYIDVDE
jgi:hypothetical protein